MRRSSGVLFVLLAWLGFAGDASAQQDPRGPCERPASEFSLEQNYPNPFVAGTATRIPFTLCESLFAEGRLVVVSLQIVNVIQQFVAAPAARNHPAGDVPVVQLEYLQPGRYFAEWDGRDQNGTPVARGIYWVRLTVNGAPPATRRISVSR
jgi:hypothetical protein